MTLRDLIKRVPVVTKNTTISDVAKLMISSDSDVVVVVDSDNTVYGVVTSRDIVRAVAQGANPETTVERVASRDFLVTTLRANIWEIVRVFENSNAEIVVVVSEDGKVEGVVTLQDLMHLRDLMRAALSMMPHFESYVTSRSRKES